jgi:hypothetical protein
MFGAASYQRQKQQYDRQHPECFSHGRKSLLIINSSIMKFQVYSNEADSAHHAPFD